MSKEFERADIQGPVKQAINDKLKELGVEPTQDHQRRTIRALLHAAGKMMLEAGGSASTFRSQAEESFNKERTSQEYVGAGQPTDITVDMLTPPANRSDKRFLGGHVVFATRDVKSNLPIFGQVEERGSARFVREGSALDIALRASLGKMCVGGGSPIMVTAAKSAVEFTIEYTTGYSA